MGWTVAALALALIVQGAAGCRREVDPEAISLEIVTRGRYAVRNGAPEPVEETSTIRCEPGVIFGVDYRVVVSGGGSGTLPLSFWWVHPELSIPSRKLWGTETPARSSELRIGRGERALSGRTLWTIEHPEERVDGRYRFEIRRTDDGTTLVQVPFDVEGC
jgi:hypothetical protein